MSGPTSRYLVTYDIENDRVRSRVSTVLESAGWRVQKSVFECVMDADGLERHTRLTLVRYNPLRQLLGVCLNNSTLRVSIQPDVWPG